jgi:hypothetical protein
VEAMRESVPYARHIDCRIRPRAPWGASRPSVWRVVLPALRCPRFPNLVSTPRVPWSIEMKRPAACGSVQTPSGARGRMKSAEAAALNTSRRRL